MKRYSGIIVRFDDKYLLCKRNYKGSLPGIWSIPGGHMEDNETPENCARREFFEETNHKIDNKLNLVGFIEHTNHKNEMNGLMYVYFYDSDYEINPDLKNAQDGDELHDLFPGTGVMGRVFNDWCSALPFRAAAGEEGK